jgi:hypothetical protein
MKNPLLGDRLQTVQLEHKISDAAAAAIASRHPWLDESYLNPKLLITESSTVLTPTGEVLFHLVKGRLDHQLVATAKPLLRDIAKNPVIGGYRGTSSGGLEPTYRQDGSLTQERRVPFHEN